MAAIALPEKYMRYKAYAMGLSFIALWGCGGGSNSQSSLNDLRLQAATMEAEARALGVDAPCSENAQCSVLMFDDAERIGCAPGGYLEEKYYKVYSLMAPTAAQAKSAANEQRKLALQARTLQQTLSPSSERFACLAISPYLPGPVCKIGKCVIPSIEEMREPG